MAIITDGDVTLVAVDDNFDPRLEWVGLGVVAIEDFSVIQSVINVFHQDALGRTRAASDFVE